MLGGTYHLDILKTDGGIDGAADDCLGSIHADAHRGVILWLQAKVARKPGIRRMQRLLFSF